MNKLLEYTYAASMAFSQAIVTFAQIRADQQTIAKMSDKQFKDMVAGRQKAPLGFTASQMNPYDSDDYITINCVRLFDTSTGKVTKLQECFSKHDASNCCNYWLAKGECAVIGTTKVKRGEWDDIPF